MSDNEIRIVATQEWVKETSIGKKSSYFTSDDGENFVEVFVDGAEIFNDYTNNRAGGAYSHAEGYSTQTPGEAAHAEGQNTMATATGAHAEGVKSSAYGAGAHAEGESTMATAPGSHAEGKSTYATGSYSHAEGQGNNSPGLTAHAEGHVVVASAHASHAQGFKTGAHAEAAHAEGLGSVANGMSSHAEGIYTIAAGTNQHVQGIGNIQDTAGEYLHIVGNASRYIADETGEITGVSDEYRSNAHTLDHQGNAWYAGNVYVGSTDGKNKDAGSKKLATEEYVNNSLSSVTPDGLVAVQTSQPTDASYKLWVDEDEEQALAMPADAIKYKAFEIATSAWSGSGPYTYTMTANGITADTAIINLTLDAASQTYQKAQLDWETGSNTIKLSTATKPTGTLKGYLIAVAVTVI